MIQDSLFQSKEVSIEQALQVLEETGKYKIEKIKDSTKTSLSYSSIVSFFYEELEKKEGVDFVVSSICNKENDFKALKSFIKKSKEIGWNRSLALTKLKELIELVFLYYKELELKQPPASLCFLLSKSGNWIFSKALQIHKFKIKEYPNSQEFKDRLEEMCSRRGHIVENYIKERHNDLKAEYKNIIKDNK